MKEREWEQLLRYLAEMKTQGKEARRGWKRFLVPLVTQETVEQHTIEVILLAEILGQLEGENPEHCAILALHHDAGETRTGDIDDPFREILASLGIAKSELDKKAEEDQRIGLPQKMQDHLEFLHQERREGVTKAAQIVHDSNRIALGMEALRLQTLGFPTKSMSAKVHSQLQTESGKMLWERIQRDPLLLFDWRGHPAS